MTYGLRLWTNDFRLRNFRFPHINVHQLSFQHVGQFHNGIVIPLAGVLGACGEHGNPVVNAVVKRQEVMIDLEIPAEGIEIVFLVDKAYFEVVAQYMGDLVKALQATVIVDNGFGAS